jgi:hypothetical protein
MTIVEQAVWALGNIASDSCFHRDIMLRSGGIPNIIYAIKNMNDPFLIEHSAWSLSNMCRGQPLPPYEVIADGIPVLVELIAKRQIKDKSIMADCCWAISYNTNSERDRIQLLLDFGLERQLVEFLGQDFYSLLVPSVRIVGHITMGDHLQTQKVLDQPKFFDYIYGLLHHGKKIVRA